MVPLPSARSPSLAPPVWCAALAWLLLLVACPLRLGAFPAGQQTYFILGYDPQVREILNVVSAGEPPAFLPNPPTGQSSIIGITVPAAGQRILYDHGEDGYEPDYSACLAGSCAQATTEIWGDGNTANGVPPGDPGNDDNLVANQVLTLESSNQANAGNCVGTRCNFIPLPRVATDIRYGGEDVVYTVGQPINVVHILFPSDSTSNTVLGGALEVFPVEAFQDSLTYTIPAGVDTYAANGGDAGAFENFKYAEILVQATENNTPVVVDNGTGTLGFVLQKGQSWSSRGTLGNTPGATAAVVVNQNTTVTGGKPIQVALITGGAGRYQTRFFNIIPTGLYASEYMAPVFSSATGNMADVIVNNPNSFPITVTAQDSVGTTTMNVAANSPSSYRAASGRYIPNASGLRLTSDSLFWGIGLYDTGNLGAGHGTAADWGYALQPNGFLERVVACAHGPGNRDLVDAGAGGAGLNGSPIWVAPIVDNVTFTVDWNGDGVADQVDINNDGAGDGTSFTRNALQALTLYKPDGVALPNDDQTGGVVRANGRFVSAWGYNGQGGTQDPGTVNNLDWGYTINPFDFRFQEPTLTVRKTASPASLFAPGGTVTFSICAETGILVPVENQDIVDLLPPGWSYVAGSAVITYPDNATVALEPAITGTQATGFTLTWNISESLNTREEVCVTFQATVALCFPSGAGPASETWQAPATPGATSYAQGTGWNGNWTEAGETTDPVGGEIQVRASAGGGACSNTNHLEFRDGRGRSVRRSVDLSNYCRPELTLSRRSDFLVGGDRYLVEASSDGTNFSPLATFAPAQNNANCTADTYDLSAFRSATAAIRFRGTCVASASTVTDNFSAGTYSGGTGWAAAWQDFGDNGNGTGDGDIRVIAGSGVSCPNSSNHLRLDDVENEALNENNSDAVSRAVDLTQFCSPRISFDWRVVLNAADEGYSFQASADGGANWSNLRTWVQADVAAGCTNSSFDLSAFRTANARIRFTGDAQNDAGDQLLIDNLVIDDAGTTPGGGAQRFFVDGITITETGATPPSAVDNVGRASGEFQGFPFSGEDTARVFYNALRLQLAVDKAQAQVGEVLTYTLTYTNLSGNALNPVSVIAPIPAFTTLVGGSISSSPSVGATVSTAAKSITWSIGSLAGSGTGTLTYQVTVNQVPFDLTPIPNLASGLVNGIRVIDSNPVETLIRTPVFQPIKNAPGSVSAGQDIPFDFQIYNHGGAGATNVVLTDRIPANTGYVVGSGSPPAQVQLSNDNGSTFAYVPAGAPGTVDATVTHIRFLKGAVAAASSTTAAFTVRVNAGTPANTVIRNFAFLANDQTTVRTTNITETIVTDLQISLSANLPFACPRRRIRWDLQVTNLNAVSSFTNVVVVQPIPTDSDYELGTASAPAGWTIEYSTNGGTSYVGTEPPASSPVTHLRFTRATLAPSTSFLLRFDTRVSQFVPAGASVTGRAQVTSTQTGATVIPSNLVTLPTINVRIVKSASVLTQVQGGTITWTLEIQNIGAAPAQSVVLQDPLPGFDIFTKSTLVGGSITGGGSFGSGTVTWNLGTLIPFDPVRTVSFQTTVNAGTPSGDVITNLAESTDLACQVPSNVVQVQVAAPGVTAGPDSTFWGNQGDVLYYPAIITNTGASPDTMELSFVSSSSRPSTNPDWTANISFIRDLDGDGSFDPGLDTVLTDTGGAATVDTGVMQPGTSMRILVRVQIPPDPPVLDGDTNTATVTARSTVNSALFDPFTVVTNVLSTTSVRLGELTAVGEGTGVRVRWATFSEFQNLGFTLERSTSMDGPWEPVGCCMIPGVGSFQGRRAYDRLDPDAPADGPLWYRLTDHDALGGQSLHGPVSVDRDGDGIPFDREHALGLSDADPRDAGTDPDGDGMPTGLEIAVGRDPGVADPAYPGPARSRPHGSTPPPQGIRILEEGPDHQVLELVLWGFEERIREVEGRAMTYPRLAGILAGATEREGHPELPRVGWLLPPGLGRVTVLEVETEILAEREIGPVPYPMPVESGNNLLQGYRCDPAFYQDPPAWYPAEASATIPAPDPESSAHLWLQPLAYDHASRKLRFHRRIRVRADRDGPTLAAFSLSPASDPGLSSVPAGTVFRIHTLKAGMYRFTGSDLAAAGIPLPGLDPRNLSVHHGGRPVAIRIRGEEDGVFDPEDELFLYSPGQGNRYAAGEGFHLLLGSAPGLRWAEAGFPSSLAGAPQREYRHSETIRLREYYYAPLPGKPEEDRFVAAPSRWAFPGTAGTLPLAVPVTSPGSADPGHRPELVVSFGAPLSREGSPDHHFQVLLDGRTVIDDFRDGDGFLQATVALQPGSLAAGNHEVVLRCSLDGLPPSPRGEFLVLKDVTLRYGRLLDALGDALAFRAPAGTTPARVEGFGSPDLTALDVTDPWQPRWIGNSTVSGSGPYAIEVARSPTAPTEVLAFSPAGTLGIAQTIVSPAPRVDLRSASNAAGWLAIVPSGWEASLAPLVALRQTQGLRPMVVSIESAADEFTDGVVQASTIRRLMDHADRRWALRPDYLLLAGDTHVNPRRHPGTFLGLWDAAPSLGVPTRLEYSGPDFYGSESAHDLHYGKLRSGDDVPEVAVGRIPASSASELAGVVAKIVAYETSALGAWTHGVQVVSDDGEPQFVEYSEEALGSLPPGLGIQRYHRSDTDTFPSAAAYRSALHAGLENGALLVQFVGHGAFNLWADTTLPSLDSARAASLANGSRAPLILSFTCNDGYFVSVPQAGGADRSLAEALVLNPGGGAIAYLGSGVQSSAAAKDLLHRSWMRALFTESRWRLGDAQRRALALYLAQTSDPERLSRAFNLLGDPATRLKVPSPKPPSGLKVTLTGPKTLDLTWTRSTSTGIWGYEVYRRLGSSPYQLVGTVQTTRFTDSFPEGVPGGSAAPYYAVRTLLVGGLGSAFGVEVQAQALAAAASPDMAGGRGGGCSVLLQAEAGGSPASLAPLALLALPFLGRRRGRRPRRTGTVARKAADHPARNHRAA